MCAELDDRFRRRIGGLVAPAAPQEDLREPGLREPGRVVAAGVPRSPQDVVRDLEELVPRPDVEERPEAERVEPEAHVQETATLGEISALANGLERDDRSLGRPFHLGANEQGERVLARAAVALGDPERPPQIVEAAGVSQEASGDAPVAERSRLEPSDLELGRQLERSGRTSRSPP